VLVVDDSATIRTNIRLFLEEKGRAVREAANSRAALEDFRTTRPDVALIDYLLPDGNALDLLPALREVDATVPIIILTAHGTIDLAVRALKEGAEHFLTKPVELP